MANKKKTENKLLTAAEMAEMHSELFKKETAERELKEKLIAECYRMFGRIESMDFINKLTTVSGLVWLNQVRETKAYKDIPGIKTWKTFCNRLGKSRQKVELDLKNLNTFGQDLLANMRRFKISYRDLKKLRFAVSDGEMIVENDVLKIGHEMIPIDDDHREDLKAALEVILEDKEDLNGQIRKMEKDHKAILHEETRGLKAERDMAIKENKQLKVFAPEDKDPETWSLEQMQEIRKAASDFTRLCNQFVVDGRIDDYPHSQALVLAEITEVQIVFGELQRLWDTSFAWYDGA